MSGEQMPRVTAACPIHSAHLAEWVGCNRAQLDPLLPLLLPPPFGFHSLRESAFAHPPLAPERKLALPPSPTTLRVPPVRGPHGQVFVRGVVLPRTWGPVNHQSPALTPQVPPIPPPKCTPIEQPTSKRVILSERSESKDPRLPHGPAPTPESRRYGAAPPYQPSIFARICS